MAFDEDHPSSDLGRGLSMKVPALGLYVQVPFCASKCTFCNFSSSVQPAAVFDGYLKSLEAELQFLSRHLSSHGISENILSLKADSVYIGGGTPSLLGAQRFRALTDALKDVFNLARSVEFTIEITPGSADDCLLEEMISCGVNRLSIGAQSFNGQELRSVGRLHNEQDIVDQMKRARRVGFIQISLDLIAGLPHQTERSWLESLDCALELAPEHVSIYLFEADQKSRLGREVSGGGTRYHAESVPDEEFMVWAYEEARRRLFSAGYEQYEISNFAFPGFESRHNLKYWRLEPYLGLGAGAHSFDGTRRWSNVENFEEYVDRLSRGESAISEVRILSETEQIEEFFFLGLRRREGIDLEEVQERWGEQALDVWQGRIEDLIRGSWLERAGRRVRLTERALLVSNEIFQEFVAA
jgi:oxygen-independent coproporphyrinogen III oxidase